MNDSKVLLYVKDFRAINKAEIKLDGITVVAGINGCGKSTLSKLLYWIYRGATNFQNLAYMELKNDFKRIKFILNLIDDNFRNNFLDSESGNRGKVQDYLNFQTLFYQKRDVFDNYSKQNLDDLLDNLEKYVSEKNLNIRNNNFFKIVKDFFKDNEDVLKSIEKYAKENTYNAIFDFTRFYINFVEEKYEESLALQPRTLVDKKIIQAFHVASYAEQLSIEEDGEIIYSLENDFITTPYWIDNVIYIDTPMFFQNSGIDYWQDVNEKLKNRPEFYKQPIQTIEIDDLIKREILAGKAEIKFDEVSSSFIFKTPSGAEIDLNDTATGIKAFAVLNLLLKNQSINDKTLLILDEPEVHLHPQWIIEFGRLLTLIHKFIGAKVFVATHSPDMIQALRYIPNKEEVGENVNFYLAEPSENSQFNYRDLHGEIDDIFGSFNLSLDKLERYGVD